MFQITHEGQRFFCDYCYYSATTKMIVKKHKLKKHPDEMAAEIEREKTGIAVNGGGDGTQDQRGQDMKNATALIPPIGPAAAGIAQMPTGVVGPLVDSNGEFINRGFYFPK